MSYPGSQILKGTWTPVLKAGGSAYTNYSTQIGNWVRSGSNLLIDCQVTLTNTTGGGTGNITLEGFPFFFQILNNTSQFVDIVTYGFQSLNVNANTIMILNAGLKVANIIQNNPNNTSYANCTNTNINSGATVTFTMKIEVVV